jgi:hypothetical protein
MNLPQPIRPWYPICYELGRLHGIEPAVLLAIIWRESKGRASCIGDAGHGHGLFQIDDRYHKAFLSMRLPDGRFAWEDGEQNARYAVREVLVPALHAFRGDLFFSVCAFNAGQLRVLRAIGQQPDNATREQLEAAADHVTTGGDYARDVFAHAEKFKGEHT